MIREPYFARQGWYPADEDTCRRAVESYMEKADDSGSGQYAGIVPHAGWIFSGGLAGKTFRALSGCKPEVVFLFGGHMHPGDRCVCMPRGSFGTPLGPIEVDEQIAAEIVTSFECAEETSELYQPDNTTELQLPFIRHLWPEARLVAVQTPPREQAIKIGALAAELADKHGLSALAIGSTDLTHYGSNYGFTPHGIGDEAHRWSKEENDLPFIEHLLAMEARGAIQHALSNHSACCPGAAAAAISFAAGRGATQGTLLARTTSHEIEGRSQPSMWVGYASIVF